MRLWRMPAAPSRRSSRTTKTGRKAVLHACGRMPWSAGSKGEADQRKLADAMCALLKCAAGADPNSAGYAAKVSSQNRGTDYKDEQQLLLKTGVFSEYGWSDGAIDIASTLLHNAKDGMQGAASGAGYLGNALARDFQLAVAGANPPDTPPDLDNGGEPPAAGGSSVLVGMAPTVWCAVPPTCVPVLAPIASGGRLGHAPGNWTLSSESEAGGGGVADGPGNLPVGNGPRPADAPGIGFNGYAPPASATPHATGTVRLGNSSLDTHLTDEGRAAYSGTGKNIYGKHDLIAFETALRTNNVVLVSSTKIPGTDGIYQVQYRLPGQSVAIKTVFDPKIYPHKEMTKMAQSASQLAIDKYISSGATGPMAVSVDVGGLKWTVGIGAGPGGIPNVRTAYPTGGASWP